MPSFLCVIRGQPGQWEGVAVDSGLAIEGPSFEQVRRCLTDVAPMRRAENQANRIGAAAQRIVTGIRRGFILARHFACAARHWLGVGRAHQSYMIRCPV